MEIVVLRNNDRFASCTLKKSIVILMLAAKQSYRKKITFIYICLSSKKSYSYTLIIEKIAVVRFTKFLEVLLHFKGIHFYKRKSLILSWKNNFSISRNYYLGESADSGAIKLYFWLLNFSSLQDIHSNKIFSCIP